MVGKDSYSSRMATSIRGLTDRVFFGDCANPSGVYGGIVGGAVYVLDRVCGAVEFAGNIKRFERGFR